MSIYFKPTWLYIKQHNKTGLKYFGKTSSKDPSNYKGSGVYWNRHLDVHGHDVNTIWSQLFTDKIELVKYAITFSEENNIVESKEWANLKIEDGLMGGIQSVDTIRRMAIIRTGKKHSAETKAKMSAWQKGIPKAKASEETKAKMRKPHKPDSEETRKRKSESNRMRPIITCPHCGISCRVKTNMLRFHFNNCKLITLKKHTIKTIKCPHCEKTGSPNNMSRWHFDNCKRKII